MNSPVRRYAVCFAVLSWVAIAWSGCATQKKTVTPEEARARGEQLLRQMSNKLASAQAMTFQTSESHDRVRRNGQKKEFRFSREVTLRRPGNVLFRYTEGDRDGTAWYDGKKVTLVSNKHKVWVQGKVPATIDETIDYLADHYDVPLPMADLMYSSPYDALMTPDTKGGYVGTEKIEGSDCEHLSYQHEVVDWDIWVAVKGDPLPCRLQILHKQDAGQPKSVLTFRNWNLAPQLTDDMFAAKIPEGYERIALLEKATEDDLPKAKPTKQK
jgi:hypothetical protein